MKSSPLSYSDLFYCTSALQENTKIGGEQAAELNPLSLLIINNLFGNKLKQILGTYQDNQDDCDKEKIGKKDKSNCFTEW